MTSSLCPKLLTVLLSLNSSLLLAEPKTASLISVFQHSKLVDLSHKLAPDIPHWSGFPPATRTTLFDYPDSGFKAEQYCHVGQWGTHIDPPSHFFAGLRTLDQIPLTEMIMPLVVLDVHRQVQQNPDYTLSVADIRAWEQRHGPIPRNSFVAMRTDWSKRWPDQVNMQNQDAAGVKHYPGWSLEALRYLYEQRGITASGHETTDTDPGIATSHDDYSLEAYILSNNHYQIEMLTNLDQVPESGAAVMVSWPNVDQGSGFPARVLALINAD